ncbi:MAG: Flp pilus assembly complex ATPase component TadA [Clostridiaceae bacterium]|jgi:pilus assembly protein CpaF|nr:Flp pilus assembly complex ATPase component TadA [Clostridiaceae bacterium]
MGLVIALYFFFVSKKFSRETQDTQDPQRYTIPTLIGYVKDSINEITRTNLFELGLNEVEFKKQTNKRAELKKALKVCMHGSIVDKQFVKAFIYDILLSYIPDEKINAVIPFNNPYLLSTKEKFVVLLYMIKKEHGFNALSYLIDTFELDKLKKTKNEEYAFYVSKKEINDIYDRMGLIPTREDKLEIITQTVYEQYKGLGVIDEIRDMNIDGVSGGVSGVSDDFSEFPNFMDQMNGATGYQKNYESIWVFYKGKSIKFDFLGFDSESELKRVCQIIYRYNRGGQLSEATGYRVNEMKDGSRILVVRPPFSESWAFFVRKFYIKNVTLEMLVRDENASLPINLIKYIVKGGMITSVTGQQGSGKTTMLMAMIEHIYATLTLRIQEMAFELNLRKLYPERNILSFRETETISGQMGLDIQKKTDGSVNILGEVATDPVAAWMIQMSQVASLFTLFTHHAKTSRDLVYSLRNSLLKCEMFNNEKIAEQQVVSVLDFDIHLARNYEGKRYIERITEIVELTDTPIPQSFVDIKDLREKSSHFMESAAVYFTKMTDKKIFECRNIIEFKNGKYVVVNTITKERAEKMKSAMTKKDAQEFDEYFFELISLQREVNG